MCMTHWFVVHRDVGQVMTSRAEHGGVWTESATETF